MTSSERLSSYLMLTACDHFMGKNTIVEYLDKVQLSHSSEFPSYKLMLLNPPLLLRLLFGIA